MSSLTIYTDSGVRSAVAKKFLADLGISFTEVNVNDDSTAVEFLDSHNRDRAHFPLPQFFVGDVLVWENGFKDISNLTVTEINNRIEEINASI
jgi:glutaredoxin